MGELSRILSYYPENVSFTARMVPRRGGDITFYRSSSLCHSHASWEEQVALGISKQWWLHYLHLLKLSKNPKTLSSFSAEYLNRIRMKEVCFRGWFLFPSKSMTSEQMGSQIQLSEKWSCFIYFFLFLFLFLFFLSSEAERAALMQPESVQDQYCPS